MLIYVRKCSWYLYIHINAYITNVSSCHARHYRFEETSTWSISKMRISFQFFIFCVLTFCIAPPTHFFHITGATNTRLIRQANCSILRPCPLSFLIGSFTLVVGVGCNLQNSTLCPNLRTSQVELWRFAGKDMGLFAVSSNVSCLSSTNFIKAVLAPCQARIEQWLLCKEWNTVVF